MHGSPDPGQQYERSRVIQYAENTVLMVLSITEGNIHLESTHEAVRLIARCLHDPLAAVVSLALVSSSKLTALSRSFGRAVNTSTIAPPNATAMLRGRSYQIPRDSFVWLQCQASASRLDAVAYEQRP